MLSEFGKVAQAVEKAVERGQSLDSIDEGIIQRSGLPVDEQAALWMMAWCKQDDTLRQPFIEQAIELLPV